MESLFLNSVVWDVLLAAVLPKVISFLVSHTDNDYLKKRVAYIVCFAVALLSTAATGAFSPVLQAFEAGVSLAAIVNALGVFTGIVIAKWTVITALTSQIYDKVYHAEKKLKRGRELLEFAKSSPPVNVNDALLEAAGRLRSFTPGIAPLPLVPIPEKPIAVANQDEIHLEIADDADESPQLDERWLRERQADNQS